ncbi:hypothetical protein IEO21_08594 [Rhodonia placenta]|uniref:Uncharacterized protein n=1 Tax=Rhodonia placenta TaxID=104341 RepID=A0A8H7NVY3_9APHY|nr:hypothetical protein IEO21_08594 [Postia placenta]
MTRLQPYQGTSRKLVLAIDIGTTYSGVSYCVLDPGEVPKILSVTRFPGQEGENKSRDVKIPSVLYYDKQGHIKAVGAEATLQGTQIQAVDKGWIRVEWFKLHLRPPSMRLSEPLPKIAIQKSVIDIFADYLRYVVKCAKKFISDSSPIGRKLLETDAPIEFILSHPNGWAGPQQSKMRRAAIQAGLVSDDSEGYSKIHFVTEGEASLHFCIVNGLGDDVVKTHKYVTIVDAGGGTIDLSTYTFLSSSPVSAEESVAPNCIVEGSTVVNRRADKLLKEKLTGSRFYDLEYRNAMLDNFETTTKPTFRDSKKTSFIRFGGPRDTDEKLNIKRGVLSLSGSEMESLFQPSINAIRTAINGQLAQVNAESSTILLVGGFATSPFLRSQLQNHARIKGLRLFCPEGQTSKAVAEGALLFYLDNMVRARVARHAYGTRYRIYYDARQPDHNKRKKTIVRDLEGKFVVPKAFAMIIPKGKVVSEQEEFSYHLSWTTRNQDDFIVVSVLSYRGGRPTPKWTDEEPDAFSTLCKIQGKPARTSWIKKIGPDGEYLRQSFKVIFLFGLTELKAQISWMENVCPVPYLAITIIFHNASSNSTGQGEAVRGLFVA